jgi:enoyl-CoA hydratase
MERLSRRDAIAGATGVAVLSMIATRPAAAQVPPAPALPSGPTPPGTVAVDRDGAILLIGLDNVAAQNRLEPSLLAALGKALYRLDHDPALRVGVLYGKGPDFCVGADVAAISAALGAGTFPPRDPEFIAPLNFPVQRVKPLIVAAHGATFSGGHELFLSADVRVAASDTRFGQLEVTRGAFPSGGATVRFTREAGWGNAMRYMLTGETWDAQEARRLGLLQEIAPPGKHVERAMTLARRIAAMAPLGVRATISSANSALPIDERIAFDELAAVRSRLSQSADAREAVRAAAEGRAPVFQGQ